MEFLTSALFCLGQFSIMAAYSINDKPGIPGVPDPRNLKTKISRGSGMGPIHPGYALLVLLAFAFFVVIFWMIIFYKRQKDRENKRTLFLTSY